MNKKNKQEYIYPDYVERIKEIKEKYKKEGLPEGRLLSMFETTDIIVIERKDGKFIRKNKPKFD